MAPLLVMKYSRETQAGPEDTESAWRGGVRKDGEGGRVGGISGEVDRKQRLPVWGRGEVDRRKTD